MVKRIRTLKNDLCKFADNFDKCFKTVNPKTLVRKAIDDLYKNIQNNFIKRISKEDNYFIYGYGKNKNNQPEEAKNKEYFNIEHRGNLFSKIRAHLSKNKDTIKRIQENLKVFPQGKPLPKEVQQAKIGNCYLVSTLIALAKNNPKAIENCFVQGLDNVEKEKTLK